MTLKNFTLSELPRERLIRDGVESLSLHELLAILLGTGTQGKNVIFLAQELLYAFGGIKGLLNASIKELTKIKGIGTAKAIVLKAAFGIALRTTKEKMVEKPMIHSVQDVLELAIPIIGHFQKEALLVLLRDTKCKLIHHEIIGMGTLSEVLVHPREVFQPAIRYGAASLIICHNHPSGDPHPSRSDIALTLRLVESAKIVGITLSDHIILGKGIHLSMRNENFFE